MIFRGGDPSTMCKFRFSVLLALLALMTSACAEVAPTNPFDPDTPSAQQEKGNVFGYLQLPAGFDANQFEQINVALTPTDFCPPAEDCVETRSLRPEVSPCPESAGAAAAPANGGSNESDPPSNEMALQAPPEAGTERACARYQFDEVPAGGYSVTASGGGLEGGPITFDMPLGHAYQAPILRLTEADVAPAFISGRIRLSGRRHCQHGGVIVRVTGTTFETSTRADGRFNLRAAPARGMTLTYTRDGYAPLTTEEFSLQAGQTIERPDEAMTPVTGSVAGTVVLTPFTNAQRAARVSIDFSVRREAPPEGDVDCENQDDMAEPAEAEEEVSWASIGDPSVLVNGGFVRPDLVPGEYRMTISARGYQSVTVANTIEPAEDVVLSDITLFHLSQVDAVPFAGQVTLAATDQHDGTRVLIVDEDATVIGEGTTDVNGEFSIDAAMDETYTVQVIPPVGYDLPAGGEVAYTWESEGAQFLDPDGTRFAMELLEVLHQ